MKRLTTIICSIAFAMFGIGLALDNSHSHKAQTLNAAEVLPYSYLPDVSNVQLPLDLQLSQAQKATDTVFVTKTDTVIKQVTKVKWKKVHTPSPMVEKAKPDTVMVNVPVYYLIKCKERSDSNDVSIFETQEINDCERLNEILNCGSPGTGEK